MEIVIAYVIGAVFVIVLADILLEVTTTYRHDKREREIIKSIITREEYR